MGALPKRKISTHRRGRRRAGQKSLSVSMVVCSHCGEHKRSHTECRHCNKY